MSSVSEALKILGVHEGASWEEINQAYRDLVRVWHPDRFQGDERLRQRAEEQTRTINSSIGILRSNYAPGKSSEKANKPSTPRSQTTARSTSTYAIAPLLIYQRSLVAVGRGVAATCVAYACWLVVVHSRPGFIGSTIGSLGMLCGVYFAAQNLCFLVMRRPVLKIDSSGLRSFETGLFAWKDLDRVWSVTYSSLPYLAIRCSTEFISKQPIWRRFALKIRFSIRKAHFLIACSGYTGTPTAVVHAISAQYLTGNLSLTDSSHTSFPWARLAAMASATALVLRSILGLELSWTQLGVYVAVFFLGHVVDISSRLVRIAK